MTEPTHHQRTDVAVQLDIVLTAVMVQVGLDDLEAAREHLRYELGRAWLAGWEAGFRETPPEPAPAPNPYDETDIV